MAFYTRAGLEELQPRPFELGVARASRRLSESISEATDTDRFDVFLSHAFMDAAAILALREDFEAFGLTVYVDWVDDPDISRSDVTRESAALLRRRMRQSRSLIYAWSDSARDSHWMPWELGYFDAFRGKVAVVPVFDLDPGHEWFIGREYVSLYPYIVRNGEPWIRQGLRSRVRLTSWVAA